MNEEPSFDITVRFIRFGAIRPNPGPVLFFTPDRRSLVAGVYASGKFIGEAHETYEATEDMYWMERPKFPKSPASKGRR